MESSYFTSLLDLVDENKSKISEGDYIKFCETIAGLYRLFERYRCTSDSESESETESVNEIVITRDDAMIALQDTYRWRQEVAELRTEMDEIRKDVQRLQNNANVIEQDVQRLQRGSITE